MLENDFQIEYARIDLSLTNYRVLDNCRLIADPDVEQLRAIYVTYCRHKQFISVEPMWDLDFLWPHNDVLGYYDGDSLVAWSVVTRYSDRDVYAVQFAWDYVNPGLKLGYQSLRSECAYYKDQGYHYYYLGEAHRYKADIQGFEILGAP